jgi:hypothetical protein
MRETDVEVILERAKEKYPEAKPHIISERATVHRTRLQGVHSNLRHDACTNFTLLSAIERENRALAQVPEKRMHSARNPALARGCAALGATLRRVLQQHPLEQCNRLHHPEGYACRAADPSADWSWLVAEATDDIVGLRAITRIVAKCASTGKCLRTQASRDQIPFLR